MGFLSNARDRVAERTALSYLNGTWLAPYGRATNLRLDSGTKTISIEVALKGEASPVQIEITDYEITKDGERYFAMVKGIRTSREWLTALAENHLLNRRFELPSQAGSVLMRTLD
jgi:hypothetical protein